MSEPSQDPADSTIEEVLITHELARRPSRAPDHEAENRALTDLAQALAADPRSVLQKVAEVARELCGADSAGISILEPGGEHGVFRWHAIAGAFAGNLMGTMPREASPCGEVVARDEVLLFSGPERFYPALRHTKPTVHEGLLAPWRLNETPAGTLWLLAHTPERRFDAEDARRLKNLARFASAAWTMDGALEAAPGATARLVSQVEQTTGALADAEVRYRTLFEAIDQGFCVIEMIFDPQGRPIDYRFVETNPAFERHTGLRDALGKRMRELEPAHEQRWFDTYGRVAVTGEPARFEGRAEALNGRWYEVYALRVGEPEQRRVAILFNDVTGRKAADDALRDGEERFRQFAEASSNVLWIRDAETLEWEFLSAAFEEVTGVPREQALSGHTLKRWAELIHPDDRPGAVDGIRRVRDGEHAVFEYRIVRPDGEIRWMRDTNFPIRDGEGRVRRIGGVGEDVTEQKRAEERQRFLLAELQHRVKNILGVVRAVSARTAETSPDLEDFVIHFDGRLQTLARIQGALARGGEAEVDLEEMVRDELLAHAAADEDVAEVSGPQVRLKGRAAEMLGLALHEMATNAVKYGALSAETGKVKVSWRTRGSGDARRLRLEWRESGVPLLLTQPERTGFGRDLIERGLRYELGADSQMIFAPGGLRVVVDLPLDPRNLAVERS